MSFTLASTLGVVGWLVAGAALGVVGTVLRQRLSARREERLSGEWDPY